MAYQGQPLKISYGNSGIVTDMPPSQLPPDSFLRAENITLENGTLEKARGGRRYNASPLAAGIVAVHDWHPDINRQRLIAITSAGSAYRDTGNCTFTGGVAITTGLGALTPNTFLVSGGQESSGNDKKLFLFTEGLNQLKVLEGDGLTFADIDSPASDWTTPNFPTVGVIHRNRLWAFMGQNWYASDTANHENFSTNILTGQIYPGEGDAIKGAYVFKGRLFAFKDGGFVYYLNDADSDSDNWYWQKLASNFGLAGPHGILDALNDMLAVNTTGTITSYSATQKLGDIESADIFRNLANERFIHTELDKGGLPFVHSYYYAEKKQAFFTYRTGASTSNNTLLCLDVGRPQARFTTLPKGTPECLAGRKDIFGIERPIYGDASGYVILMDQEDRQESTAAFTSRWMTPPLAQDENEKHFDSLAIEFVPEGNWNISCDYYIDGKYMDTITFKQAIDTKYLSLFTLGTDRLQAPHSKTITKRLAGTGRVIQFEFSHSGDNQNFQIASMQVNLRPAGKRQLRRE